MNQTSKPTIKEFREQLRADHAERKAANKVAAKTALDEILANPELLECKAATLRCSREELAASLVSYMTTNPKRLLQFKAAWTPA
jgi:hypothetical protein